MTGANGDKDADIVKSNPRDTGLKRETNDHPPPTNWNNAVPRSLTGVVIGRKWSVARKVGSGSFGEVYRAINVEDGEEAAIKVERKGAKHPLLNYEISVIKALQGGPGIAKLYACENDVHFSSFVMELLGPSLEEAFVMCNRQFSLKTVALLADQILQRIEFIHRRNYIHRDIKPDNFLTGRPDQSAKTIFMIDFGLAKRYRDPWTLQHIPYRENKNLTGTARYASIHAQLGAEQSRRDDLESLGYLLAYFCRGQLPWQSIRANTKQEKYDRILDKKMTTPVEDLCRGLPPEFATYLNYCRSLRFEDRPDYSYLRSLFQRVLDRHYPHSNRDYDWIEIMSCNNETKSTSDCSELPGPLPPPEDQTKSSSRSCTAPRPLCRCLPRCFPLKLRSSRARG